LKRIHALLLVSIACISLIAASALPARAQQSGKVYTYALRQSLGNQGTQLNDLIKKIVSLIFDKMGEKVQFVTVQDKDLFRFISEKKADFIFLGHSDYMELLARGNEIHPVNTIGARGHMKEYRCMAVQKNSPFKAAADLQGKSFAMPPSLGDYIGLRWYLEAMGLGTPDKVFGGFVRVPDEAAALAALGEGKIDGAFVSQTSYDFLKFFNTTLSKKVRLLDCRELPWPTSPVVSIGKLDPVAMKKFYSVLSHIDTYPEFQQLKPILNVVHTQLYLVTDKDFEGIKKLFAQSKKNGWAADYERMKKK
jgi:ABC-type phosphate/phosphonate transport system substrate-binding protein